MGNTNNSQTHVGLAPECASVPEFTSEEKQILRSSWEKLVPKTDELCIEIFLKIFEIRPEVKQFFPFRNAVGEALTKHPYFKGHAIRFINAIKMAILNIDAWELILIPNLVKLGQHHAKIPGFSHDIFELFYLAMNDVWSKYLGISYKTKTKKTWCQVFKFIVFKVEEGYLEGMAIKAREQANTPGPVTAQPTHNTTAPLNEQSSTTNGTQYNHVTNTGEDNFV